MFLLLMLDRERIEAAVNNREYSGNEAAGIANKIMYSAEEFFGLCKTSGWSMCNDSLSTVSQRAVLVGKQGTVLVS